MLGRRFAPFDQSNRFSWLTTDHLAVSINAGNLENDLAMSRPIIVIVCMGNFSKSWEALTASTSLALPCQVEEPSVASTPDISRCIALTDTLGREQTSRERFCVMREDRKCANISWAEGAFHKGVLAMCDFSLQSVRSRPAKVGDKLVTRDFGTGTRGFAAADDLGLAVCVMPGTELAFAGEVACLPTGMLGWKTKTINHRTAIFRQVNKEKSAAHHDAIEFPDGRTMMLTHLCEGQAATVLQLPAQPATAAEADAQKRVTYVG